MEAHPFRPLKRGETRRGARTRPERSRAPGLEGLEGRELLSGMVSDIAALPSSALAGPVAAASDGSFWYAKSDASGATTLDKVSASGQQSNVKLPTAIPGGSIQGLATDTAGDVWYTYAPPATTTTSGSALAKVGKVAPGGTVSEYNLPTTSERPGAVAVGPDGSVWVAIASNAQGPGVATSTPLIAKVAADGSMTSFPVTGATQVNWLTVAPDGNLWFVDGQRIGRATPAGVVSFFSLPAHSDGSKIDLSDAQLTPATDGGIWFIDNGGLERIDSTGQVKTVPSPGSVITGLGTTTDGQLWFSFLPPAGSTLAASPGAYLARMTPGGEITVFSDLVNTDNTPVVHVVGTNEATIWLAESNGTLASVSLASVLTYTPAIVNPAGTPTVDPTQGTPFSGAVIQFISGRSDATAPVYSASINWGDGSVSPGTVVAVSGGYDVTGTHTYTLAPNSTPTLMITITDGLGGTATLFNQASIQAPTTSTTTAAGMTITVPKTTTASTGVTTAVTSIRGPHGHLITVHKSAPLTAAAQARAAARAAAYPQGPARQAAAAARAAKARKK